MCSIARKTGRRPATLRPHEAVVDLVKLADCRPIGVLCEIMNDDGTMARLPQRR